MMAILVLIGLLVVWLALSRLVLPRFGIQS
jgi:hypothetical protein